MVLSVDVAGADVAEATAVHPVQLMPNAVM
jgi:hypothetical protein